MTSKHHWDSPLKVSLRILCVETEMKGAGVITRSMLFMGFFSSQPLLDRGDKTGSNLSARDLRNLIVLAQSRMRKMRVKSIRGQCF